jgi:hypothetical protein
MELASLTALGQLFLELSKEIRAVLRARERKRMSLAGVGSLLQLYGSSIKLRDSSLQLRKALEHPSERSIFNDRTLLHEFMEEVKVFGEHLSQVDLYAIEIYFPELKRELDLARGADRDVIVSLYANQLTKSNINKGKIRGVLKLLSAQYYPDGSWKDWRGECVGARMSRIHSYDEYLEVSKLREDLLNLISLLDRCRILISKIVGENWSYREILERSKRDA